MVGPIGFEPTTLWLDARHYWDQMPEPFGFDPTEIGEKLGYRRRLQPLVAKSLFFAIIGGRAASGDGARIVLPGEACEQTR